MLFWWSWTRITTKKIDSNPIKSHANPTFTALKIILHDRKENVHILVQLENSDCIKRLQSETPVGAERPEFLLIWTGALRYLLHLLWACDGSPPLASKASVRCSETQQTPKHVKMIIKGYINAWRQANSFCSPPCHFSETTFWERLVTVF